MKSVYCISFVKLYREHGQLLDSGVLPECYKNSADAENALRNICRKLMDEVPSHKISLTESWLYVERTETVEKYNVEKLKMA